VLIPLLIFSLAAIGLNLLVGYAGQLSLGTGAFMAVGAYATFKITTAFPDLNILIVFLLSGVVTAGVGILFGLPSLRIKGFYLAVATLAAQFFLIWMFNKVAWFTNYDPSGSITAPPREVLGITVTGATATAETRYILVLAVVTVFAFVAKNLVRGRIGRSWMAIRDMDIAAEIIGIRPLPTKLLAFALSSFYCGLAGAMYIFCYLGSAETEAFDIIVSFDVLFMIIIGGLGSILGSFLGAAFIVLLPVFLTNAPPLIGLSMPIDVQKHIELMIFGSLIVFFLIVEPRGLARLWQIAKEKLRRWPFPY
jgi:branched-chain amino acid transport system permease protein